MLLTKMPWIRFVTYLFALLLVIGGSVEAKQVGAPSSPKWLKSDGVTQGTLTISGRRVLIKHAYARRVAGSPDQQDFARTASIEILLSDKPLTEEVLQSITKNIDANILVQDTRSLYREEAELLKSAAVTALYFSITKNQENMESPGYQEVILTPDGLVFTNSYPEFQPFSLNKGLLTASAKNDVTKEIEYYDEQEEKQSKMQIKYNYAVSFRAKLNQSASTPASSLSASSQPPTEGKASGTLIAGGETVALKYAYARKERLFFDEPEEHVRVLMTDKAVAAELLPKAFESEFLPSGIELRGVELLIDEFGVIRKYSTRSWGAPISSKVTSLGGELDIRECAIEKERVKGRIEYKKEGDKKFSATFDVPLKK